MAYTCLLVRGVAACVNQASAGRNVTGLLQIAGMKMQPLDIFSLPLSQLSRVRTECRTHPEWQGRLQRAPGPLLGPFSRSRGCKDLSLGSPSPVQPLCSLSPLLWGPCSWSSQFPFFLFLPPCSVWPTACVLEITNRQCPSAASCSRLDPPPLCASFSSLVSLFRKGSTPCPC